MNRLLNIRIQKSIAVRSFAIIKDVTGNLFRCSTLNISDNMDEAMVDMISGNNFAGIKLAEIIKTTDNNCNLANILELYEKLRYSTICNPNTAESDFIFLEEKLSDGKLSKREALFAASALRWYEGEYIQCGLLLETVLLEFPGDLLALRLAQDVYITAGSSTNVLGCIIRHNPVYDTKPHLHGYLLGLLSTGFVEAGKIEMAIETAEKAISMTRGENSWALHSILNSYQLCGKSSDMQYILSEFISKHHECTGLNNLMYNEGSVHIMRGNYSGAYKILEEMLDLLVDVNSTSYNNTLLWRNIVLLLWKLNITTTNPDLHYSFFSAMWLFLSNSMCCSKTCFGNPLHDLCLSITLLAASNCDANSLIKNNNKDINKDVNKVVVSDTEKSTLNWFEKILPTVSNARDTNNDSIYVKIKMNIIEKYGFEKKELAEVSLKNAKNKLLKHLQNLKNVIHKSYLDGKNTENNIKIYPKLRSIKPSIKIINTVHNKSIHSSENRYYTDLEWSTLQCTLPLTEAFQLYHAHDYKSSCIKFQNHLPYLHLLGGMAVHRELFQQMYIETLCSDNQMKLVKLLLTERSVLVPNDAQCWSRLASIYRLLGEDGRAEEAHYTSWQLGIGQGGFGGPK